MRQGDTGIVETPWHTFIPMWSYKHSEYLKEFDSYDSVLKDHIEVENFYDFVQAFKMHFANAVSFAFCSDGYRAAFDDLFRKIDRLNLAEQQIRSLRETSQTYDERKFRRFDQFPDSVCRVGENDENFFDLINSAVEADIIVTGTQQTMIVQFAAQYYDLKKPKIIIMLHRGAELPDRSWHNLSEVKAALIPVDLGNYQIEELATRVRNELAKIDSEQPSGATN